MQLAKLRLFYLVVRRAFPTCNFALIDWLKKLLINIFYIFNFKQVEKLYAASILR